MLAYPLNHHLCSLASIELVLVMDLVLLLDQFWWWPFFGYANVALALV